ncbi:beta-lactamase family protein [Pseudoalteromonas luteoviolacea]|uniref:serine hydrolase domain-containing protein n=1 Tax=Pseudoalteromonas luteoviolacea TaxID=43657 RepID=UPI001F26F0A1|nr:serine hydrolase domain-containing protein [Pseudoalteromonas luteoviolacea]MCF6437905.1 beta-lactamase family protein [Pseudoalteromonas luteoviolacea]
MLFAIFIYFNPIEATESFQFSKIKHELDKKAAYVLQAHGAPGVAIAFIQGDKILGFLSYGAADIKTSAVITKDTMFNVGSISKVVTTWGVMQLVQNGQVDLDKPINQYLKRWKLPRSHFNTNAVTLRNVLSHTSGLSLGPYVGWNTSKQVPTIVESLKGHNNGAGTLKLIYKPGSRFSYSGGGYSIVQLLIEDVSGMGFEDYMQKKVFKPLGMISSTFDVTNNVIKKSAIPYDETGKQTSMLYFAEQAAAGLQTTALDLARFGLATLKDSKGQYNGAHLLSSELIEQMITPVPHTKGRWSMSYIIDSENESLGFSGFNRGWISLMRLIPEQNLGYVILTNSSINGVSNEIDNLILRHIRQTEF